VSKTALMDSLINRVFASNVRLDVFNAKLILLAILAQTDSLLLMVAVF
jgi:hypothetical protein